MIAGELAVGSRDGADPFHGESELPTDWRVKCALHGAIYLTEAEYGRQLARADKPWSCPRMCGEDDPIGVGLCGRDVEWCELEDDVADQVVPPPASIAAALDATADVAEVEGPIGTRGKVTPGLAASSARGRERQRRPVEAPKPTGKAAELVPNTRTRRLLTEVVGRGDLTRNEHTKFVGELCDAIGGDVGLPCGLEYRTMPDGAHQVVATFTLRQRVP